MSDMYIGIDIGGSKVAISLADGAGALIETVRVETPASPDFSEDRKSIFAAVAGLLGKRALSNNNLAAIGISCPGPLDLEAGRIVYVATTGWRDIPVREIFEKEYGVPVVLENDAATATYAEAHVGAGRGAKSVAYFTVSTGVGGGFVVDGEVFSGAHGMACEFGHLSVDSDGLPCNCGSRGCVQEYASGTSIARAARELIRAGEPSSLVAVKAPTARDVAEAVRAGDALATRVWDNAMGKLGAAAALVHQVLDPEVIVFGGGVSNDWDLMEERLLAAIRKTCCRDAYDRLAIKCAALGSVIGTTGAVLLARAAFGEQNNNP